MFKCPPFASTQAPGASLQGEDPDCGGVAAAHYGGVGTPRLVCHRQRSEAVELRVFMLLSLLMMDTLNICCEGHTTFAYNAEFYTFIAA